MKPVSDFTTPRRLIAPISRHFFPVEQPEPFCCTTGLKNGSRLPLIAHFFSSLGGLGAFAIFATKEALACCFGSGLEADATVFAEGAFTTATVLAATALAGTADLAAACA